MDITTDGMDAGYYTENCKHKQYDLHDMCETCGKYFTHDMLLKKYENFSRICYHCFYWLNYSDIKAGKVINYYGLCPDKFIEKCKKDHNKKLCKELRGNNCILCENEEKTQIQNKAINIYI